MPKESRKQLEVGDVVAMRGPLTVEAANDSGKNATFAISAYNGGPMWLDSWMYKVVVDLAGLKIKSQAIPILRDHRSHYATGEELGLTKSIKIEGNSIVETGELFTQEEEIAAKIAKKAKKGFPYQASIGAKVLRREFLESGEKAEVNGLEVKGPLYIARESELYETSIVTFGADETTNVEINANKEADMHKEKSPEKNPVQAAVDPKGSAVQAAVQEPVNQAKEPAKPAEPSSVQAAAPAPASPADQIQAARAEMAAEFERVSAIRVLAGADEQPGIVAKAIKEGWNADKAELEILRANRPQAPMVNFGERKSGLEVLECAMRMVSSEAAAMVEKDYETPVLEAADKMRSVSLRGLIAECCRLEGVAIPSLNANPVEWIKAGFSTASLSTLLGNTANKMMISSFNSLNEVANIRKIAKKLSANDFKSHTGVRLTANVGFEELGSGGEIKHGTFGNDSFTYSVVTYARMLGLTRVMIVNDDLNAFSAIPLLIGRGAALKMASVFWGVFTGNANSFFHADNANLDSNSLSPDAAGYKAAVALLRVMKDNDDNPISVMPKYVVAPVALDFEVNNMYASNNLLVVDRKTGSITSTKIGDKNIYAGKYEPITSQYLDAVDAGDWYMLADPSDTAAFGVAYLQGKETPVIEEVPASGEYLGKAFRGYLDFGACQIDPQGAVKMA